jgi:hypothetical protein
LDLHKNRIKTTVADEWIWADEQLQLVSIDRPDLMEELASLDGGQKWRNNIKETIDFHDHSWLMEKGKMPRKLVISRVSKLKILVLDTLEISCLFSVKAII